MSPVQSAFSAIAGLLVTILVAIIVQLCVVSHRCRRLCVYNGLILCIVAYWNDGRWCVNV